MRASAIFNYFLFISDDTDNCLIISYPVSGFFNLPEKTKINRSALRKQGRFLGWLT